MSNFECMLIYSDEKCKSTPPALYFENKDW